MVITKPKRSNKFKIFPTPKKRRKIKTVMDEEMISPLLELAKITEEVKKVAKKVNKKNKGMAPKVSGLTK